MDVLQTANLSQVVKRRRDSGKKEMRNKGRNGEAGMWKMVDGGDQWERSHTHGKMEGEKGQKLENEWERPR